MAAEFIEGVDVGPLPREHRRVLAGFDVGDPAVNGRADRLGSIRSGADASIAGHPLDGQIDVAVSELGQGVAFGEVELAHVVGELPDLPIKSVDQSAERAAGTDGLSWR